MATGTGNVAALYEDVVADLIPYYDNFVLLPNPSIIVNSYNIVGASGDTVKVPLTNSWTAATNAVSENTSILGVNDQDFIPDSVLIAAVKRGAGTEISTEALEDGGMDMVRQAVITRLSRSLAQATDLTGMRSIAGAAGTEAALTGVAGLHNNDGANAATLSGAVVDTAIIMSPEGAAHMMKREPSVKMFEDVDKDNFQMIATVRNGTKRIRDEFVRTIASSTLGDATAEITLDQVAGSVAQLRAANAPTDGAGFYAAVITPGQELALAKLIAGVSSTTGTVGSLSELGNSALIDGLIGQAVGCRFVRSNNTPSWTEA
jgi:hypothetical protein